MASDSRMCTTDRFVRAHGNIRLGTDRTQKVTHREVLASRNV